jgi:Flp pilus assembly protein CpaB
LLQNVRVLAVAQELPEETASSNQDSEGEGGSSLLASRSNPSASTVTLEVLPQQAQMISTGDLKGDIRLSLRPFGEESTAPVSPILVPLEN